MRKSNYPKNPKTLGQKIRKKRMDLNKYLIEVAKEVGITESYLSRIEADKQIPTLEVAQQLENALGVSAGEYAIYTSKNAKDLKFKAAFAGHFKRHVEDLKRLIEEGEDQLAAVSPKDKKHILESWEKTYKKMIEELKLLEKNNLPANLVSR